MKITKSRLLQIIREEVELHEKNIIELDENFLEELTDQEEKKAIDDEIEADEAAGNLEELAIELEEKEDSRVIKKEKYKTTPSLAAAAKGKVHKMTAVAKQASSWADEPFAVAQATKKATDNFKKTEEDKLFDPRTKEPINNKKQK